MHPEEGARGPNNASLASAVSWDPGRTSRTCTRHDPRRIECDPQRPTISYAGATRASQTGTIRTKRPPPHDQQPTNFYDEQSLNATLCAYQHTPTTPPPYIHTDRPPDPDRPAQRAAGSSRQPAAAPHSGRTATVLPYTPYSRKRARNMCIWLTVGCASWQ